MNTVPASIPVLRWAADRAGLSDREVTTKFPRWPKWLSGEAQPTMKQLEAFAKKTHIPFGYFFLPEPPAVRLPVADFRSVADRIPAEPSTNLLDTIYLCQQRQDWFREHALLYGMDPVALVGSASLDDDPLTVGEGLRQALGITTAERQGLRTWTDALRHLIAQAEAAGVLVMASSIVGSNSHRKLEVEEFRGFALADSHAPVVFINAADSKSAQMFTLAHELAHICLGESGVLDPEAGRVPDQNVERWCNAVAAEMLMPLADLQECYDPQQAIPAAIGQLARQFKVSTLVVLRRLFEAGLIDQDQLWQEYRTEVDRIRSLDRGGSGGGDFYRTLGARTGKRFARAVIASTLEGQTLFTEAFRMLGVRKSKTFYSAAHELGVLA